MDKKNLFIIITTDLHEQQILLHFGVVKIDVMLSVSFLNVGCSPVPFDFTINVN